MNDRKIERVLFDREKTKSKARELSFLRAKAKEHGFSVDFVDGAKIDEMTIGNTHGGIVAVCTERTVPSVLDMKITENGVAYIYISRAMKKEFHLTNELASASVGYLENIKGCLCWIAFIDSLEDEKIRVRLRSRFVAINTVAEQYRGGGHAQASGATLHEKKEMRQLLKLADKVVKEYKETHEDWL
jgi:hypothetical protein